MKSTKIKGWVVRDCIYGYRVCTKKPIKEIDDEEGYPFWSCDGEEIKFPNLKKLFPNLKYGDAPVEVEIIVNIN